MQTQPSGPIAPGRRDFIKTVAAATIAAAAAPVLAQKAGTPVRFGIDMFSLGAQNWTPFQHLDFAAKWNVKVVHFSEIRFLGSLEPDHLNESPRPGRRARHLDLEIGMRSICPTSAAFDKAAGTAEEQLARMIDAAKHRRIADRARVPGQLGGP